MRTDAKIGFAIVGVLFAVLMGFFVVNSRHNAQARNATAVIPKGVDTTAQGPVVVPPPPIDPVKPVDPLNPVTPVGPGGDVLTHNSGGNATGGVTGLFPQLTDDPKLDVKPNTAQLGGGAGIAKVDGKGDNKKVAIHARKTDRTTPPVESPVASANQRHYTIRAGQTLISIASDVYGDPMAYKQILSANPKLNPSKLKVGTKIVLPDPSSVRPRPSVVVPAADVIYADTSSDAAITAGQTYRVQPGDSLYKLAKRFLGSGRKADALYELNREVIGASPSRLRQGMILRLPTAAGALSDASR